MEASETLEEKETLLLKDHEHKPRVLSLPVEVTLHTGAAMACAGVSMIAVVDDPELYERVYLLAATYTYYGGAFLLTIGGFLGILRSRHHNEFFWFLTLFVGTLLSVWNGVIEVLLDVTSPAVFYAISGAGCLLVSLAISRITLFRHDKFRIIWKSGLIVGISVCHVISISDIKRYRLIALLTGIGLTSVSYTWGRIRSVNFESGLVKSDTISRNT
jgi:hypothetical protein